jgi:hypothetical protein
MGAELLRPSVESDPWLKILFEMNRLQLWREYGSAGTARGQALAIT